MSHCHIVHCVQEAKREAEYEKAARAAATKSPLASLRNLYGESVRPCSSIKHAVSTISIHMLSIDHMPGSVCMSRVIRYLCSTLALLLMACSKVSAHPVLSCASISLQGKEHPPVVLVDGYNLLHKFVGIMQLSHSDHPVAAADSFEEQRIALQDSMVTYSQRRGIKVVIAYDAINRVADPVYLDIRTSSRCAL